MPCRHIGDPRGQRGWDGCGSAPPGRVMVRPHPPASVSSSGKWGNETREPECLAGSRRGTQLPLEATACMPLGVPMGLGPAEDPRLTPRCRLSDPGVLSRPCLLHTPGRVPSWDGGGSCQCPGLGHPGWCAGSAGAQGGRSRCRRAPPRLSGRVLPASSSFWCPGALGSRLPPPSVPVTTSVSVSVCLSVSHKDVSLDLGHLNAGWPHPHLFHWQRAYPCRWTGTVGDTLQLTTHLGSKEMPRLAGTAPTASCCPLPRAAHGSRVATDQEGELGRPGRATALHRWGREGPGAAAPRTPHTWCAQGAF